MGENAMMTCPHCGQPFPESQELHFFSVKWATNHKQPWAARILGLDKKYSLSRDFLPHLKDYSDAASYTHRVVDIKLQFIFKVGWIVEVCESTSKGERRAYYRVESATSLKEVSVKEVLQWAAIQ